MSKLTNTHKFFPDPPTFDTPGAKHLMYQYIKEQTSPDNREYPSRPRYSASSYYSGACMGCSSITYGESRLGSQNPTSGWPG